MGSKANPSRVSEIGAQGVRQNLRQIYAVASQPRAIPGLEKILKAARTLMLRFWFLPRHLTLASIRSALPEAAMYGALITAGLWVILDTRSQHGSNFFYLLFLPVIIAAVRQGFDGSCFRLLVTQIGLVLLPQHHSVDAETFTEFQTLMFVLTATAGRFSLVNAMASALAYEINQPITASRALARSAQHILRSTAADRSNLSIDLRT
jgi:hypothetical protein